MRRKPIHAGPISRRGRLRLLFFAQAARSVVAADTGGGGLAVPGFKQPEFGGNCLVEVTAEHHPDHTAVVVQHRSEMRHQLVVAAPGVAVTMAACDRSTQPPIGERYRQDRERSTRAPRLGDARERRLERQHPSTSVLVPSANRMKLSPSRSRAAELLRRTRVSRHRRRMKKVPATRRIDPNSGDYRLTGNGPWARHGDVQLYCRTK